MSQGNNEARVSIGLPTYNRPRLLKEVVQCFQNQSFQNFELLISDNASPDPRVRELAEEVTASDHRFRYVRHSENRGVDANFWFVFGEARAPLFMWAADDDLWPPDFLERGVAALDVNPKAAAWFCQIVNINSDGAIVRSYPSFRRFRTTALKSVHLARFLWEPEIMGKANLLYSIYRRETLFEAIEKYRTLPVSWGGDMNLAYGYLCRNNLIIDDKVVLKKRVPAQSIELIENQRVLIYPREMRALYFGNYRAISAGTRYWLLTATVLAARSAYDYWGSGLAREYYDFWKGRLFRVFARLRARLTRI